MHKMGRAVDILKMGADAQALLAILCAHEKVGVWESTREVREAGLFIWMIAESLRHGLTEIRTSSMLGAGIRISQSGEQIPITRITNSLSTSNAAHIVAAVLLDKLSTICHLY